MLAPKATTGNEVRGAKVNAIKIPVITADKSCAESLSFKNIIENNFSVTTAEKIEVTITRRAFAPYTRDAATIAGISDIITSFITLLISTSVRI